MQPRARVVWKVVQRCCQAIEYCRPKNRPRVMRLPTNGSRGDGIISSDGDGLQKSTRITSFITSIHIDTNSLEKRTMPLEFVLHAAEMPPCNVTTRHCSRWRYGNAQDRTNGRQHCNMWTVGEPYAHPFGESELLTILNSLPLHCFSCSMFNNRVVRIYQYFCLELSA